MIENNEKTTYKDIIAHIELGKKDEDALKIIKSKRKIPNIKEKQYRAIVELNVNV